MGSALDYLSLSSSSDQDRDRIHDDLGEKPLNFDWTAFCINGVGVVAIGQFAFDYDVDVAFSQTGLQIVRSRPRPYNRAIVFFFFHSESCWHRLVVARDNRVISLPACWRMFWALVR